MVEIYIKTNTNYTANGDITLKPIQCTFKYTEQELTLIHLVDNEERYKFIEVDNIISVGYEGKKIFYRIHNVIKSLFRITCYARPIFYDLANSILLDVRPTNKNGQEALNEILANTNFTGHSNISTVKTSYLIRKNIVEAITGDDENSFVNRWGGEVYVENWDVYVNDRLGSDNGVEVRFSHNLNEIEEEIDLSQTITRIIPLGYNGIMLDGPNPYVSSPNVNKYSHIKTRVIEFSDVKVKEDPNNPNQEGFNTLAEAQAELIKRSQDLFTNGIDQPLIHYRIDMINLSNTTYYKDFKDLLRVNIGDTIKCHISHLNIDVTARVIDYEIDYLTGEYISIELGNVINNYIKDQVDIQHRVNNITNDNGTVKADVLSGVIDAHQTMFKATKDVAQPQDVLGMIFEDRVESSPTFGSLMFSSQGMAMADKYVPGTENFDYRTFLTGSGIVADAITTGEMSANRVRTGLIEDVNKTTQINLDNGTYNFANKVVYDGTNLLINANNLKTDAQGNMSFTGKLQPNDYQLRLFGNDCKIDGSADKIRLQLNPSTYIAVDVDGLRLFNQHSQGGTRYTSITYGSDGHTSLYNDATRLKLLSGAIAQVQCRNTGDTAYGSFVGSAFNNQSSKKYKTNIENPNIDFIKILKENKIKKYQLKDDMEAGYKLGFILEDLSEEAKEFINPKNTEGIDVYSMCSMLWGIVQEQQKQIEELKLKGGI